MVEKNSKIVRNITYEEERAIEIIDQRTKIGDVLDNGLNRENIESLFKISNALSKRSMPKKEKKLIEGMLNIDSVDIVNINSFCKCADNDSYHFDRVRRYSGHKISDERLRNRVDGYETVPKIIHIYHLKFVDGMLLIDRFDYRDDRDIGIDRPVEDKLNEIYDCIVSHGHQADSTEYIEGLTESKESNFDNIVWDEVSYIAFFIDRSSARFVSVEDTEPVHVLKQDETGQKWSDNGSFFDGKTIPLGKKNTAQCYYFINHAKESPRAIRNVKDTGDMYRFDIFILMQMYDIPATNGREKLVIIDPPGDHKGPPFAGDND